jgi:hypothetical protein
VTNWIARVPTFRFNNAMQPSPQDVATFLARFWLPDENIVYIGKATCLRNRLGQFRRHRLGDRKPHAGGHWLKTLKNLNDLQIFFCECDSEALALAKESEALRTFVSQVSPTTRTLLYNPSNPIPFANREFPKGTCKQAMICGDVIR